MYEPRYLTNIAPCVRLSGCRQKQSSWYIRARGRCRSCLRQGGQNPWPLRSELSELECGGNPRSKVRGRGRSSRSRRRGCQSFRGSWWKQSDFHLHRGLQRQKNEHKSVAVEDHGKFRTEFQKYVWGAFVSALMRALMHAH